MTDPLRSAPRPPALPPEPRAAGPEPDRPRRPYLMAGPQTWELVKACYLAGATAREAAERFGVGEGNVRKRAHFEGWTKAANARALEQGWAGAEAPAAGAGRAAAAPGAASVTAAAPFRASSSGASSSGASPSRASGDAPAQADPLDASRALLRQGAALAQQGRMAEAAAAVRLSGELARAARALGLAEAEDACDEDEDEEEPEPEETLTEEELEALRADVSRRFARFNRPKPEAAAAPAPEVSGRDVAGAEVADI